MSWLLVERLVQVSDHDIGMVRNVKEIREDLDRLPIFHLRLWRLSLNLLLAALIHASGRSIFGGSPLLLRPFRGVPTSDSLTSGGFELVVAVTPKITA